MKLDSSISAIVTGGASGLGGATVRALRAHGVKVAIFDMNEKTGVPFAAETGSVAKNPRQTAKQTIPGRCISRGWKIFAMKTRD